MSTHWYTAKTKRDSTEPQEEHQRCQVDDGEQHVVDKLSGLPKNEEQQQIPIDPQVPPLNPVGATPPVARRAVELPRAIDDDKVEEAHQGGEVTQHQHVPNSRQTNLWRPGIDAPSKP
eukprot:CAMPEP_0194525226 /NCGR_PEP_ID=MMETSP0253-20130528/60611_1 /TAXON_ID=2966 /ORGANISM="Noctiluca scintillans" /LENGTH=117 /DNA_ID=CAMNT_0039369929 /DNA_START=64 /DNA_END=417 /DNA_ORIENTATION=-